MRTFAIAFAGSLQIVSSPMAADVTSLSVQNFQRLRANGGEAFALVIKGMEDGIGISNAVLVAEGKSPLYCPPPSLVLNHENALQILTSEIAQSKRAPDAPLSLVLLDGLRRNFPCAKK